MAYISICTKAYLNKPFKPWDANMLKDNWGEEAKASEPNI